MDPAVPALVRDAPVALALISANRRIAFATRAFEELVHVRIGSAADAGLPAAVVEAFAETSRTRKPLRCGPVLLRDGSISADFDVQAVFERGAPAGWFCVAAERRVVEERERVALLDQVARDRERLGAVLAQSPVALAVFQGAEHRIEIANARYEEMVGQRWLTGRPAHEVFPGLPHDLPIAAALDRAYAGERVELQELCIPVARAGVLQEAWFHFVIEPLRDPGGKPTGSMVVATEVTEQVLARRKLDALREQAEAANRSKDEFLAMLGHELRNPLAPIVTALQLLRMRSIPGAETERALIERQVQHLLRLVDDLLDVSRVTRGKVELRRRPLELAGVISSAIEQVSPIFEQRGHHLALQIQPGLAVDGDPARLAQVISNLLTNAAKYTPERGHIDVRAMREGGDVRIEVQDDGMGIAHDLLPRVFELFVQGAREFDRGQGGLGLGLAIVRSLVQLHGGRVEVASPGQGRGSTFTVWLPALDALPAEPAREPTHKRPVPRGRRHRVLIVDDNVDAAYLLGEAVTTFGHDVRTCHDGPAALELLDGFLPDVALLDLGLPAMDGFELARRIRARPGGEKMHLIAVTGYGQRVDRERSREAGFDLHLVKPVDLDDVAKILRELHPR